MGHHFDTHQMVKHLMAEGFKEKQAEALVETISKSREFDLYNLATKTDLHELKADMLKWMFGMQFTAMSLIIAAMKFL